MAIVSLDERKSQMEILYSGDDRQRDPFMTCYRCGGEIYDAPEGMRNGWNMSPGVPQNRRRSKEEKA
jgi:hypothetical protein